ncbi:unnamed protein product [Symbiodinium sp. CCMP2592]|nr:unnamed protein product [Symbiodinium sp. CCMP2592]
MLDPWDAAFQHELQLQREREEVAALDREPTEDESDSIPSTQYSEYWWSEDLLLALASAGVGLPMLDTVGVVSCCTGCCAEGEVMKALQIPYEIFSASETEASFREFVSANQGSAVHCMHDSLQSQLAAAPNIPAGKAVRLLMAGSPCDPFSVVRPKRFQEGSVDSHGLTQVTMQYIVRALLAFRPHVSILEQVEGFVKPISEHDPSTPLDRPEQ